MSESYELGRQGEELVVDYLQKRNYRIADRRWHDGHLEIDIVAVDIETGELVSIEVKTRESEEWGLPEEAVDIRKIRRTVSATDLYMRLNGIGNPVRFDIFSVIIPKEGKPKIIHFKDAFYPPVF